MADFLHQNLYFLIQKLNKQQLEITLKLTEILKDEYVLNFQNPYFYLGGQ